MAMKARGQEDVFLVFVEGREGRRAPYAAWFAGGHMADMRALPGVASAHAFRLSAADGPAPAELCAIYEFAAGPAVLDTIGRVKGTGALPHSEDQGRMVWRLFETLGRWPDGALPEGAPLAIVLIEAPRDTEDLTPLLTAGASLAAQGAAYVRTLRLSPAQPARGSEYGAALLVAGGAASQGALGAALERCLPGTVWRLLRAEPLEA
jgi:hypothetical protein